jgi:hypothetical protein
MFSSRALWPTTKYQVKMLTLCAAFSMHIIHGKKRPRILTWSSYRTSQFDKGHVVWKKDVRTLFSFYSRLSGLIYMYHYRKTSRCRGQQVCRVPGWPGTRQTQPLPCPGLTWHTADLLATGEGRVDTRQTIGHGGRQRRHTAKFPAMAEGPRDTRHRCLHDTLLRAGLSNLFGSRQNVVSS